MTKPIILTDLDDTLFQTQSKIPGDSGTLTVMSKLADGSDSGYATEKQIAFLTWLQQAGDVIPVTARGSEVLGRVNLPYRHAIAANGGVVLKNNGEAVDTAWQAEISRQASKMPLSLVKDMIEPCLDDRVRSWPVTEGGIELYYCVKSNTSDERHLDNLRALIAPFLTGGWRIHQNGNNLAFLPPWLNKRHAVAHLIAELRSNDPHRPVVGIGDSHSDVGFMDLCDYAMTPTNSQIWKAFKENNEWCR